MAAKDKHNPIYMARLAEQTERFDDMIKFVKEIIRDDHEVTEEVNNLISIAYKNVISANRSAWRAVANLEQKEKEKKSKQLPVIKWYRKKLEQKLDENCHEVLGLAETLLGKCKEAKNPTESL